MKNPFAAVLAALSLLLVPGVAVAGGSEPGDDAAELSPAAADQPEGVARIAVSAAAAAAAAAATVAMGGQDNSSEVPLPPHRPSSMARRSAR